MQDDILSSLVLPTRNNNIPKKTFCQVLFVTSINIIKNRWPYWFKIITKEKENKYKKEVKERL